MRNLLIDCRDKSLHFFRFASRQTLFATLNVSRFVFIVARNQKRRKGNDFGRSGMDNCVDGHVVGSSHNHLGAVMQIAWARKREVEKSEAKIIRQSQTDGLAT